jgi:transposase InsO family protein
MPVPSASGQFSNFVEDGDGSKSERLHALFLLSQFMYFGSRELRELLRALFRDLYLTLNALEMALTRRCPSIGLLHHSDQGSTYASEDYRDVLTARGLVCSMSRRANCYDNAVMERFFSTVKSELADQFASHGDAKMELFDYIEVFYNQRRRHSTLGQISPAAFERRATQAA